MGTITSQEVVDSVSYTKGSSKMTFKGNYLVCTL